jgi:LmbE family N-acetylglucosaminyl deacetylase
MIGPIKRLAVIAPHPDDETLGAGGTMARFAREGASVSVLVVSGHLPPLYPPATFETTKKEADAALKELGVANAEFLKIPATRVHELPVTDLNGKILDFLKRSEPDTVLLPFPDRHIDHRTIFDATLVGCRPTRGNAPRLVLAYETLSETHWNAPGIEPAFVPEVFVDIGGVIERKKSALACYASQINDTPSRSIEACMALARFRGSQNGCDYAEAFKVIRALI